MGEYWVTNVKKEGQEIKEVKALMRTVEGLSNPVKYKRNELLDSIEKKNDTWYTCKLTDKEGVRNIWKPESLINVVEINDKKFLRIDDKKTNSDSLGDIPKLE